MTPIRPQQKKRVRRITHPTDSLWGVFVALLFGGLSVLMGLVSAFVGVNLPFDWRNLFFLFFFGLGGALCWSGISRARLLARFSRTAIAVEPEVIRPGDSFLFSYRKRMRQGARASITASLVLRETVVLGGEDGSINRDHLVESRATEMLQTQPDGTFSLKYVFGVPPPGMEPVGTGGERPKWVVKMRIQPEKGGELWEEYEILTDPPPTISRTRARCDFSPSPYEVVLTGSPRVLDPVMQELMPHLDLSQRIQVGRELPATLIRTQSLHEARSALATLSGGGAKAEVRRAGALIESAPSHSLPIPGEAPSPCMETLPLPGDPTDADER